MAGRKIFYCGVGLWLLFWLPLSVAAQFLGGEGDGLGGAVFANGDPCAYFFGDSADGLAAQVFFNPDSCGSFEGGNADGMAVRTFASPVPCPTFYGSSDDGFAVTGSACFLLPVVASDLQGRIENGNGYLWWYTFSEVNNTGFSLQKSRDRVDWRELVFIPGRDNSQATLTYDYWDLALASGVSYYRWVQTDRDGATSTSNVVALTKLDAGEVSLLVWPSPLDRGQALNLAYTAPGRGAVTIVVFDLYGREVERQVQPRLGNAVNAVIATQDWAVGAYAVQVRDAGRVLNYRVMVH
ncbi:MAG: hypothetical protein AAGN35_17320 [Bacteroidota bacterium]